MILDRLPQPLLSFFLISSSLLDTNPRAKSRRPRLHSSTSPRARAPGQRLRGVMWSPSARHGARPFDRNERCGGLWSASPRLHLWSLLTVRSHALLGFFLDHYARHGVLLQTNAHVVLHEDFAPTTDLVAAQKALSLRGVSHDVIPSVDARLLEPIKIAQLNRAIRKLPEDALVIFADGNTLRLTTSTVSARR